ncbi:MAG: hypothetical protein ACE37H_09225 [Phycisphaeraceae bacterium]
MDEVALLEARVSELKKERRGLKKRGSGAGASGDAGRIKPSTSKSVSSGGLHFGSRPAGTLTEAQAAADAAAAQASEARAEAAKIDAELKEAKKKAKRAKKKFDPAQEAFARELKDRWLEQVAARPGLLAAAPGRAKYAVTRSETGAHPAHAGRGLAGEARAGLPGPA